MKSFNIFILATLAVAGFVASCAPKEDTYKKEIEKIIVEAQVPLIQLESNFNGKQLSYQIENPNFYDSVKIMKRMVPEFKSQNSVYSKLDDELNSEKKN